MKILFHPCHLGYLHTHQHIAPVTGLPMAVPYRMADMQRDLQGSTRNVGNCIHVEAPARMLSCDWQNSASTTLQALCEAHGGDPVATARAISARFDYVVVSEANVFRMHGKTQEQSEQKTMRLRVMADVLDNLTIPFAVLGAGLQTLPPDDLTRFDRNITHFLRVVDSKATLLGVRGRITRGWLARVGISRNVKALGCPSMYVYPQNIQRIRHVPLGRDSRVLTAGYLRPRELAQKDGRVALTAQIAAAFRTDYVMQDDFYELGGDQGAAHYNEATGEVDRAFVLDRLATQGFNGSTLRRFLHYRNSYAWRAVSGQYDAFIGDRLHGGIVTMQAMRPAVIFHDDNRVKELASLFHFPTAPIGQVRREGLTAVLDHVYTPEAVERFADCYAGLLRNFRAVLKAAGLALRMPA